MLTELSEYFDANKFNDLRRLIDHKDTKKAFGAEAEIAVLWAISRVAHMEPQRVRDRPTPDAVSNDLFISGPSVVEVRAVSDHGFGKEAMERTANIISSVCKVAAEHLQFHFNERPYYKNKRCLRKRCVDPEFALTPAIKAKLRNWLKSADGPNLQAIRIIEGETEVLVSWHESVSPLLRTSCSMPPVAYHLMRNPIYNALKKKKEQVKAAASGTLRCIVLVDAGCYLLRHLRPMNPVDEIGGEQVIRHALSKLSIDVVAVVSPHRTSSRPFGIQSELFWNVTCFDRRKGIPNGEYERLEAMAKQLPRPQYEARQAREVHRQGGFSSDQRNWYFRTEFVRRGGTMTIKLSAGLLHEYLSGRLDATQFNEKAFGTKDNVFEDALRRGYSIRNIQFEPGGIDADDDYIAFELDTDWDKVVRKNPVLGADAKDG